jgi:hypothetical protein
MVLGHRNKASRQKSAALQRLADFIERITAPPADNVVPLRPAQAEVSRDTSTGVTEPPEVAHG